MCSLVQSPGWPPPGPTRDQADCRSPRIGMRTLRQFSPAFGTRYSLYVTEFRRTVSGSNPLVCTSLPNGSRTPAAAVHLSPRSSRHSRAPVLDWALRAGTATATGCRCHPPRANAPAGGRCPEGRSTRQSAPMRQARLHRRVPPRATVRRCPQCDFASRPYLVAGVSLSRSHAAPLRIRCDPCAQLQSFLRHARAYFPPRDRSQRGVNGSCGPGRLDDLSLPSVEDTNLSNFAETSVAPCGRLYWRAKNSAWKDAFRLRSAATNVVTGSVEGSCFARRGAGIGQIRRA